MIFKVRVHLFGLHRPRENAFQLKNIGLFFHIQLMGGNIPWQTKSRADMPTLSNLINKALYLYYEIGAVPSLMKGLF